MSPETMFLNDPDGRFDPSGKPVAFYPSTRALAAGKNQVTAAKAYTPKAR